MEGVPEDVARKWERGKLEKRCPDCGTEEAATDYCSLCLRPAHWSEFFERKPSAATIANMAKARAALQKARQDALQGTFPLKGGDMAA